MKPVDTFNMLRDTVLFPHLTTKHKFKYDKIDVETGKKYLTTCIRGIKTEMSKKYPDIPCKVSLLRQDTTDVLFVLFVVCIDNMPYYSITPFIPKQDKRKPGVMGVTPTKYFLCRVAQFPKIGR